MVPNEIGRRKIRRTMAGLSSKSCWRNAKTPCINKGLGKEYLKQQGLFSLRDGWIKCHHG